MREISAESVHQRKAQRGHISALHLWRPRLRIIRDPISKLNLEMLYRQVQYLVEEEDRSRQGIVVQEVP